jgi:CBS domain-containing protein
MKARDVQVSPVITVKSTASVKETAALLLARGISAVPVVDDQDKLAGIVSEGDLIHRSEIGTERRRSWWLGLLADGRTIAAEYIKSHAVRVVDVMTRDVVTASPDTPLHEIATIMEKNGVKRVPIVDGGRLVGIVSRADLVRAFAAGGDTIAAAPSDRAIRDGLVAHLAAQSWAQSGLVNGEVSGGVVDLWGYCGSEVERHAFRVAAETAPGVRSVNNHMIVKQHASAV